MHAFDLKSNEWHIAALQIYENLFRSEVEDKNKRGELKFSKDGEHIPNTKKSSDKLTMTGALRPLLEFIDGYRRRVAAP